MIEGVKSRARMALTTRRANESPFYPRQLIADLLSALDALECQLQAWIDVAGVRQDLIDQVKAEKRVLQHEVDRLEGKRKYCTDCGGGFVGDHDCGRKKR